MRQNRRREIRVVISPRLHEPGFYNAVYQENASDQSLAAERRYHQEAERIASEIRRHVDDAEARVVWDYTQTCSFCGYDFDLGTEPASDMPFCCDEAQVEYITEHPDYTGEDDDLAERVLEVRAALANPESN